MAEMIKLPVIGPAKRTYVYAGGALIVGIVGYAWFSRTRSSPAEDATLLPEDIPQERTPPPTVVGSEDFDDENVRAIINTNAEWFTAAIDYLVTTGGFDFTFASIALGKFLARRQVTENEANVIQAAKGAVGEPPQGGPWPIVRAGPTGPSTGSNKLATPVLRTSAGDKSNTNQALAWGKVSGASYYILRRTRGPGAPTSIAVIGTYRRTPALKRGSTYEYQVKAISITPGVASSDWSKPVSFRVATKAA